VVARRIGMKRNAEKDLSLTAFGEFPGIFFVGESTSVRQQVNFGFRQFRTNMAKQLEQPVTEQGRFATRNPERTQFPRSGVDQSLVFLKIAVEIVAQQRRLAAHDAAVVAL